MERTRVVVVSDSHLSARTPEAVANWDAVVKHIHRRRPDLVVHTGDITADGAAEPADFPLARHHLARVATPLHAVPGNHDIGDNPHPGREDGFEHQPAVSEERLARYRATFGPDQWSLDVPGWRLVGVNALLFGSGLAQEAEQWDWLASILRRGRVGRSARPALFLHKPMVASPTRPQDTSPGRYVLPEARRRLSDLLAGWDQPAVIVSGHVHQFSWHQRLGLDHLWAPTTWAVIPDSGQPRHGRKVCGVVELALHDDGACRVRLRQPPGVVQRELDDHDLTVAGAPRSF